MIKKTNLKIWLFTLLISAIVLSACGSNPDDGTNAEAGAVDSKELTVSHFLPSNHPIQNNILKVYLDELEEKTDGRITSEIYSAGALGDPGSQYDMAVTGTADVALSVHGFTPGRFPIVSVVELPFLVESAQESSDILWTLYEEFPELKEEHKDTTPLWLFTVDPAQLISAKKKIETPSDLKGLRVRTPSPLGNQIIEALGGTPVSMPMGEVYDSLQKGVVDAAMVPISEAKDYNLHEVVKYITIGNFSVTPFFSVMNTDIFNSFTEEDQKLIHELGGRHMVEVIGQTTRKTAEDGRKIAEENGVEIIELSGDNLAAWEEALTPISEKWVSDLEAKGLPGQKIFDRVQELKGN
ncbi:TRAP system periplasmic protein [Bacillus sp. OxB-1]|uniref:TRAP transporter substrate-binding protein n=1 Tax=Bacillus sp. (strain OxB-1) TaxID=98228 RepID=UPI000581FA86|nr:TRAP transporter substrate-binding protein [Bacillus sp. OxB-1]BAQ08585.1 TRAP system periplasmic protein [Bacillus sp. OxB-1]